MKNVMYYVVLSLALLSLVSCEKQEEIGGRKNPVFQRDIVVAGEIQNDGSFSYHLTVEERHALFASILGRRYTPVETPYIRKYNDGSYELYGLCVSQNGNSLAFGVRLNLRSDGKTLDVHPDRLWEACKGNPCTCCKKNDNKACDCCDTTQGATCDYYSGPGDQVPADF